MVLPERYGALPQSYMTNVKEEELVGSWQHIDLGYNYGKMDEALNLVISSDHTMSGALSGKWSFDSASQVLTFTPNSGTSVSVKVERELDWESSPRKPTIVYAGTQKNLKKSYWGKKSSVVVQ